LGKSLFPPSGTGSYQGERQRERFITLEVYDFLVMKLLL